MNRKTIWMMVIGLIAAMVAIFGAGPVRRPNDSVAYLAEGQLRDGYPIAVGLGSIDTAGTIALFEAPQDGYIVGGGLTTPTALAKHGSAFRTFQLKNLTQDEVLGDAVTTEDIEGGVAITANTPLALNVTTKNRVNAGDVIALVHTKDSTPAALTHSVLHLQFTRNEEDDIPDSGE